MMGNSGWCARGWPLRPALWPRLRSGISLAQLGVTLFWAPMAFPEASDGASSLEYNVKAAYLLNFTKFVEWPPSAFADANAPLTICILGDDPFGRMIDQIVEGESVNRHRIVVERLRGDERKACHLIYFGNNVFSATMLSGAGTAVLTVGEGDDFIHQGGVIAFVLDNRRVRFDINLKAAVSAGLKLSSKLLSVARYVEK